MKKKNKQKIIVLVTIATIIFPIIVKALDLNLYETILCIGLYSFLAKLYQNFNFGEALQMKLSIIT
jgi:hypothetical protein